LKICCVLQYHYDDEHDKTMFHNTTPDLQDQDRSVQHQDQERFIWSQACLVLRPTVSDHITIHVDLPVLLMYSNVDNYRQLAENSVIFTV